MIEEKSIPMINFTMPQLKYISFGIKTNICCLTGSHGHNDVYVFCISPKMIMVVCYIER